MSKQKRQKENNNIKPIMIFTLAAISIIVIAVLIGTQVQNPNANQSEELELPYETQPVLGAEDASVQIVEFGDYKCPACQAFDESIFTQLKTDFIDNGKVSFYFMNYPFIGADSETAALAGEAVYEQDKEQFWAFHHALFENQGPEEQRWATKERLLEVAEASTKDLDIEKLEKDIEKKTFKGEVESDKQILDQYGFKGTPTLFINGKEVENPFDYKEIKSMIEAELENE
ncbi:DsbA family protein [Bacillus taeanensis]|nr:DsbA family protein [Bacillus taeanensis]